MWPFKRREKIPNPQNRGTVVIGSEMAAAQIEEGAHSRGEHGPSPISSEMHYDEQDGDLLEFKPSQRDDSISALCRHYAESTAEERLKMRNACSLDDFYVLIAFAKRSGVLALRTKEIQHIRDGATAVAMLDANRVDYRDILITLAVVHGSATEISADADPILAASAAIAEPETAKLIVGFIERVPSLKSFKCMGYMLVKTEQGLALANSDHRVYSPTLPLERLARDVAAVIRSDKYRPNITLATDLPAVWLRGKDFQTCREIIQTAVAGVSIGGTLRSKDNVERLFQLFVIFIIELPTMDAASRLMAIARQGDTAGDDFISLALTSGKLFALVVAKAVMADRSAVETRQRLERFREPLWRELTKYATVPH